MPSIMLQLLLYLSPKKNLTMCDKGIWITTAKYTTYRNLIALRFFFGGFFFVFFSQLKGEMWGQNLTVYFMLRYSVILDPKISTIPILVMNGM